PLVLEQRIPAAANTEAARTRRDDLDERIGHDAEALASQPGDHEAAIRHHVDGGIDAAVGAGDGQLYQLADDEGSGRLEMLNLPLVEERRVGAGDVGRDDINATCSEEGDADRIALALIGLEAGPEDRRE